MQHPGREPVQPMYHKVHFNQPNEDLQMSDNTNVAVSTKLDARGDKSQTALTINWEGMSREDLIALATQPIVIKLQAAWRRAGSVPGSLEIKATDYKIGTRNSAPSMTLDQMLAKLTPDEIKELFAKYNS